MSINLIRVSRRRGGSIVCGLLGLLFVAGAVQAHVDGVRTNHLDYRQNLPMMVLNSVGLLVIGGALLLCAWRLWRAPGRSQSEVCTNTGDQARVSSTVNALKRPRLLYFVAAWCSCCLFIQASYVTRLSKAYQGAAGPVSQLLAVLSLVALGFVVWQTVGLVHLKRFHRWFAVAFFCWWSAALVWNVTVAPRPQTVNYLPFIIVATVLIALNLLSVWYLTRRTFREFAVQFAAARQQQKESSIVMRVPPKIHGVPKS